jgi:hypothetical protein
VSLTVTVAAENTDLAGKLDTPDHGDRIQRLEFSVDDALLTSAAEMLVNGRLPEIELRRDKIGDYDPYALVRRPLRLLAIASLLTLATFAAATWSQARRYKSLLQTFDDQKQEVFQQLYPENRVPIGVRSRLESERQRLIGLMGNDLGAPELESATPMLLKTLDALPSELRFRLLEMQFENATGYLEGEVRRHGDADVIAAALRAHGLSVEPPRTEQLEKEGVSFILAVAAPNEEQE